MANDIQAVVYTDDDGNAFITGMDAEIFAQQGVALTPKVGGRDAVIGDALLPPMPRNLRPRRVRLVSAGLRPRYVTCLTQAADLWTGVETALTIEDSDGVGAVYTRWGTLGEKKRKRSYTG